MTTTKRAKTMKTMNAMKAALAMGCSVLALGAAAGCDDGAADGGGTTLKGQVARGSVTVVPAVELALVWSNTSGSPDVTGETLRKALVVPATGAVKFSAALDEAPPASLLNDYTKDGLRPNETKIGIAAIVVVPKGYDLSGDDAPPIYSVSEEYLVAWVDSDIKPGTFSAALVGGTLKRGYHLLKATDADVYRAAHPELAKCETLETSCELPADLSDRAGITTYYACVDAAASAAGCLVPKLDFDHLAPASGGFGTSIQMELTTDPDGQSAPNWT